MTIEKPDKRSIRNQLGESIKQDEDKTLDQIESNQESLVDSLQDFEDHKLNLLKHLIEEFEFKKEARVISIRLLIFLTMLILLNLTLILYWNPVDLSTTVIVALITASFANIFAIVLFVFKYIFSPTKEIMEYSAKLNIYKNEQKPS